VPDPFYIKDKVQRIGPVEVHLSLLTKKYTEQAYRILTRAISVRIDELPAGQWQITWSVSRAGRKLRRDTKIYSGGKTVYIAHTFMGKVRAGDVLQMRGRRIGNE